MSPPINPDSTLSRVLACLERGPRSTRELANELGMTETRAAWKVSRAVWHLRQRGVVRRMSKRPDPIVYAIGYEAPEPRSTNIEATSALLAMQSAARTLTRLEMR